MARWLLIRLVRLAFKLIARVELIGLEHLSSLEGPTLIVANHLGRLDAPLILSLDQFTDHPNLIVVVAEKYQKYWIYRWAVRVMGFLWLDRFGNDIRALRQVVKRLSDNGLMVIAPEGTRSQGESLIEAKQGAAYIAGKTQATIVPVGVIGTEDRLVRQSLVRLRRVSILMRIGRPFTVGSLPASKRGAYLESATEEIMCQIGSLLPRSYHGFYAGFSRLEELIVEEGSGQ